MAKVKALKDNEIPDNEIIGDIDPKIYNQIAKCAQLLSVQMIESNFVILPQFFNRGRGTKPGIDFSDVHAAFDEESRVVTCIFALDSYVKSGNKRVFSCKGKFVVFYGIPSECDETHATAFARKVGLTACYPYFRSYVASTASMANAEIPILPTISAMPVRGKIKEAD